MKRAEELKKKVEQEKEGKLIMFSTFWVHNVNIEISFTVMLYTEQFQSKPDSC